MSDTIRKAVMEDLPQILEIYEAARDTMRNSGNPNQWKAGNPSEETLLADIQNGNLYLILNGDTPRGCFVLIAGDDPTYAVIEDGAWSCDDPYCTIHRLAGRGGGIFRICVDFCLSACDYLRVDTHRDNHIMLRLLERAGFTRCGRIYVADGSPRIAFDYRK